MTDETEQRKRFENERVARKKMGKAVWPEPVPFLETLPHMPEASGNALGIDRLVMLLGGFGEIDRVVSFTPEEL